MQLISQFDVMSRQYAQGHTSSCFHTTHRICGTMASQSLDDIISVISSTVHLHYDSIKSLNYEVDAPATPLPGRRLTRIDPLQPGARV